MENTITLTLTKEEHQALKEILFYWVDQMEYDVEQTIQANDPNGTSIDDCMGVAIEKYVSIHKVVEGIERGIYRKVDITPTYEDTDLEPTQEVSQYQDEKVLLLTYYGLVPREYLNNLEENKDIVELFPDNSYAEDYTDMVEAIESSEDLVKSNVQAVSYEAID